ncbi:MAG: substrate-binding domain-containing protein [Gammaproteobacteria bacterium]
MKKFTMLWALCAFLMAAPVGAENVMRMSTTTSTENSGLLSVLNPVFEKKYDVRLDVIAVGTGKALKLAENGDVDLVFVHAPKAEEAFVAAGFGVDRKAVMHNDFVLIGTKSDPAGIKGSDSAIEAFRRISRGAAAFISRGDDSGTDKKEKALWRVAGIIPEGSWYISTGQGMGAVLQIADEKQAYTLTDRGTYIAYQEKIELEILFEGDEALFNPYHVIAVNPQRYPEVKYNLAKKYIEFVTSAEGQSIIAGFKKAGQQLFYPDAVR